jgi:hypothetical protein
MKGVVRITWGPMRLYRTFATLFPHTIVYASPHPLQSFHSLNPDLHASEQRTHQDCTGLQSLQEEKSEMLVIEEKNCLKRANLLHRRRCCPLWELLSMSKSQPILRNNILTQAGNRTENNNVVTRCYNEEGVKVTKSARHTAVLIQMRRLSSQMSGLDVTCSST